MRNQFLPSSHRCLISAVLSALFVLPSTRSTYAFVPSLIPTFHGKSTTLVFAEGGPPQYDKMPATLKESREVSKGSVLLTIAPSDEVNGDLWSSYRAGHVVALEFPGSLATETLGLAVDEKAQQDMDNNNGWLRGPYTISRSNSSDGSLDILIKVVGTKSISLSQAPAGTPLRIGGKFHVPIVEGIDTTKEGPIQRIVMLSTGVGVGPCWGALQEYWSSGTNIPMKLVASYRQSSEEAFAEDFTSAMNDAVKKFHYKSIITSDTGRLSATEENLKNVLPSSVDSGCPVEGTHYHLIGNGKMVNEWKQGLVSAGVPENHVTIESYFNHREKASAEAIERIAKVIGGARTSAEAKSNSKSDEVPSVA